MPVLLDDAACVKPETLYEECLERDIPASDWWGRANSFQNPLGEGPGKGILLLRRGDLTRIKTDKEHDLTFTGHDKPQKLKRITVLNAIAATPGAKDDPNAIMVVYVVDRRYKLSKRPAGVMYNVRIPDGSAYKTSSLRPDGTTWSWVQMIDDLWTKLHAEATSPATTFTSPTLIGPNTPPDAVPEGMNFIADYAWHALNVVYDRLGRAICYDPLTDEFSIVPIGTQTTTVSDLDKIAKVWDDQPVDPALTLYPEKVRVVFQRLPRPCSGNDIHTIDANRTDYSVTTGEIRDPESIVLIRDDMAALLDADGNITNTTELALRATRRAEEYYRALTTMARFHRVFDGAYPQKPTGTLKVVAWEDRGKGVKTSVYCGPDVLPVLGAWEAWYTPDKCCPENCAYGGYGGRQRLILHDCSGDTTTTYQVDGNFTVTILDEV